MKFTQKTLVTIFVLWIFCISYGGVNLKNGNFYISYNDYDLESYNSALDEISRTYNSKSTYTGLFGYGWNSDFETFINVYPDNSISLHEKGGGLTVYFSSDFSSLEETSAMIDTMIKAAIAQGDIDNSPSAILELRKKLADNIEMRTRDWDKYVENGILNYKTDVPDGMEWTAKGYGTHKIIKTQTGYLREKGNGEKEFFNPDGKLIKIEKRDGSVTEFEYINGELSKIIIPNELILNIKTNENGFITEIKSQEETATFKYDEKRLIESTDAGNNIYQFSYDVYYNLTSVTYEDGSKMLITYHPKTLFTKSVTDRNGETTEYEYIVFYNEDGSENDDHYATKVIKTDPYSEEKYENYYEYLIKTKPNGERFTYMTITDINGYKTTTFYDEVCTNNIISITKGDETTNFKYNPDCNLTEKKTSDGEEIFMEYHPVFKKLTKVTNNEGTTIFEYNDNAELVFAKVNDEKWIKLTYDNNNKIIQLEDNGNKMKFEYNTMGKPVKVELEGKGTINVEYDQNGEILSVNSTGGHQVSLMVTQTFQQLLGIVKPAGVNLGF